MTQFNWPQVYFAINRSVWINLGRKYVFSTQLTVLTFHKLSFDISEVIVTEVMCGPRAICLSFRQLPPRKFILFYFSNSNIKQIKFEMVMDLLVEEVVDKEMVKVVEQVNRKFTSVGHQKLSWRWCGHGCGTG